MQGLYDGMTGRRYPSKKAAAEAIAANPEAVDLEATSLFGNEFAGPVADLPLGAVAYVVGPDPATSRRWYGVVERDKAGRLRLR